MAGESDDEDLAATFEERFPEEAPRDDAETIKRKAELLKLANPLQQLQPAAPGMPTQDDPATFNQRWGATAPVPAVAQGVPSPIEPEMKFADRWGAMLAPTSEAPLGTSRGVSLNPQAGGNATPLEQITSMVKLFTGLPPTDATQPEASRGFAGSPPNQDLGPADPMETVKRSISRIESGSPEGDYSRLGPITSTGRARDRAYGRYQVMGRNIGKWTEQYYGRKLSPAQFLANREAQDAVFEGEFGRYVQKYGSPSAAAAVWFGGPGGLNHPDRTDRTSTYKGISIRDYVNKFDAGMASEEGVTVDTAPPARGDQGGTPRASTGPLPQGNLAYLGARGGHNTGNAPDVNPEFAARLTAAGQAYEAETGNQARFGELARDRATQARYYARYRSGVGGLAAPPGRSRHEGGEGVDVPRGDFRDWLAKNADRFGVETLKGNAYRMDPVHFQMARGAPSFLQKVNRVAETLNPISAAMAEEAGAPTGPPSASGGAPAIIGPNGIPRITVRPMGVEPPLEENPPAYLPPGPPGASVSHTEVTPPGSTLPPSGPTSSDPGSELRSLASPMPQFEPLSDPAALNTAIQTSPTAVSTAAKFLGIDEPQGFAVEGKKPVRLNEIISHLGDQFRGAVSDEYDVSGPEMALRMLQSVKKDAGNVLDYMADHYNIPDLSKGENWSADLGGKVGRAAEDTLTAIGKGVAAGLIKLPANTAQAIIGIPLALTYGLTKHKGVGQLASFVIGNLNYANKAVDDMIYNEGETGLSSDIGEFMSIGAMVKGLVTKGVVLASPELAKVLEQLPDVPTIDKISDALVTPAMGAAAMDVVQGAKPIPNTDLFTIQTPGGPVAVTEKDLQSTAKMAVILGGFMAAPGYLKMISSRLGPVPGMPRPLAGFPEGPNLVRTDAADLMHANTLSHQAPLFNILDRFAQEQVSLNRAGVDPRVASQVAADLRMYSNSGMHNLVTSAMRNGEMNTPTMTFRVPTSLQAMEDAANQQPQFKNYIRLKLQEDELNHNAHVLREALQTGASPARIQEIRENYPLTHRDMQGRGAITIREVRDGLRRIENAFPEVTQFHTAWRDYIAEGQRFVTDGQYAAHGQFGMNAANQHVPNTPVFHVNGQARAKIWEAARRGDDPLVLLEKNLEAGMYNRMHNEVKWRYVEALPEDTQFYRVAQGQLLTDAELKRRGFSSGDRRVMELQRDGVSHTFVGDPLTIDLLTMEPASYRGGIDTFLRNLKTGFQVTTTGALAPYFAVTAATRTWWQMLHTAPPWSSRPGPFAMAAELPRQLVSQRHLDAGLSSIADWIRGGQAGQYIPGQFRDRMARAFTFETAREFNRGFERAGGRSEDILRNVNDRRTAIAQGRQLSPDPGYQRMLGYIGRVVRSPYEVFKFLSKGTGAVADLPNTAWARQNRNRVVPETGQPISLTRLASEMRRLTGDPAERGALVWKNAAQQERRLSYQNVDWADRTGAGLAKFMGGATETFHYVIPWSGVLVRSPASTLTAMANNPWRTGMWLTYSQAMPSALAYFWNRQLGPEYINHAIDGRGDNLRDNYLYIGVPGRPPHEGFEMPMPQEGLLIRRSVDIIFDQLFNRSPFTLQEEQADLINSFLKTNLVPPLPSPITAAMAGMGVAVPGGILGSPFIPRSRDFRQLNQQDNSLERVFRALLPSIGDYWTQYYMAAHAASGGTFDEASSGAEAIGHRVLERTPWVRDALHIKPSLNAQTRLSEELFKRKKTIDQLAAFATESSKDINVGGRSGPGMDLLKARMPGLVEGSGVYKETQPAPGIPQPPPTNPLYANAVALIHEKFKRDLPTRGGGGYMSMWQLYGAYGKAIDSMRNVNEGNSRQWIESQKGWTPKMRANMAAADVDTNNFRDVKNYYINKRNLLAAQIFYYVREAEADINKNPQVRQILGPKEFKLEMLDPYKPGLSQQDAEAGRE